MAVYDELSDRVVLITGGANGIGRSMVEAFHSQGAVVCFCDVDEKAGSRLAKRLGERAEYMKVNLCHEADIKRWMAGLAKRSSSLSSARSRLWSCAWVQEVPTSGCGFSIGVRMELRSMPSAFQ